METEETKTEEKENWPDLRYEENQRSIKSIKETEESVFVEFEKYKKEES